MIRAVTHGKSGPLLVLGIVEANVEQLREGRPIHVDIGELMRMEAARPAVDAGGTLGVVIMWGATHVAIIDELEAAHVSLPPNARPDAERLDELMRSEASS